MIGCTSTIQLSEGLFFVALLSVLDKNLRVDTHLTWSPYTTVKLTKINNAGRVVENKEKILEFIFENKNFQNSSCKRNNHCIKTLLLSMFVEESGLIFFFQTATVYCCV